jgi:DNA-binding CsgD family transcriptional regulator
VTARVGPVRRAEGEWLDLLADVMAEPLAVLPEERLAVQLCDTFAARGCAFQVRAGASAVPVQRIWPLGAHAAAETDEINRWSVRQGPVRHPVLRYYLATRNPVVMQVADVPSAFAGPRVIAQWHARMRDWRIPAQMALPLAFDPTGHRAFALAREDAFGADELALARRLQRLLIGVDRQVVTLAQWRRTGVDTEAAGAARLTAREVAVLALVADGLTAAAVARRLQIAERTVHKHLERSYLKLGVRDRLSAVLRAQRAGVLPTSAD